jgi:hypothetical protein
MSFKAIAKAWDVDIPGMTCLHKIVLIGLAQYANEEGVCWPSQEKLAYDCLLCDRTVRKILADLEKMELISRKPRSSTDGRRTDLVKMFPQPESCAGSATGISVHRNRNNIPVAVIHETVSKEPVSEVVESPEQSKPKEQRSRKTHPPVPAPPFPTKDEWVTFCKSKWPWFPRQQAEQSFDYYEVRDWHMGSGSPVKNWKSCALTCSSRWAESHQQEVNSFRMKSMETASSVGVARVKTEGRKSLMDMLKQKVEDDV